VRIVGNVGADAATAVFATSDGDLVVETTDRWFGTDDADGSGSPAVIHLVHGGRGLAPTSVSVTGDNVEWSYNLTVGAGETKRLGTFTVLGTTRAQAIAAANVLVGPTGFGGQADVFLTAAELASLANFAFVSADNDSHSISESAQLTVNAPGVLDGDVDGMGLPLRVQFLTMPANGYLSLNYFTGGFSYRPFHYFNGTDTFTYRATNGTHLTNVATVSITVTPVNNPPLARNDSYAANQDRFLFVSAAGGLLANDTDVDSSLTAIKVTNPAHGTVGPFGTDGSFWYTPTPGYFGSDSFTYKANDGSSDSNVATVFIMVNPTGSAPAPVVDSVRVNDGSAQRSMVTSLTVTFTTTTSLPDSAFRLVNRDTSGQVGLNISRSDSTGRTVATLEFSGTGIVGGSLADGNYLLTIDREQNGFGIGSDYQLGANEVDKFFRYFGDSDGDRDVDNTDYFTFRGAYSQTFPSTRYLWYLDSDDDNDVDGSDLTQFNQRYRKRLTWTP
jgi:hypothetical protein